MNSSKYPCYAGTGDAWEHLRGFGSTLAAVSTALAAMASPEDLVVQCFARLAQEFKAKFANFNLEQGYD